VLAAVRRFGLGSEGSELDEFLEADSPNIELRKLLAKIRRDGKLGIKAVALLGKREAF
jgi:hypothetical protein